MWQPFLPSDFYNSASDDQVCTGIIHPWESQMRIRIWAVAAYLGSIMFRLKYLIATCVLALSLGTARAESITYTESATISGSLGGTGFSDDVITLTGSDDPANVVSVAGLFENNLTVTFSIAGAGAGTWTDVGTYVFDAFSSAGFSDHFLGIDILDTQSPALATYKLTTSIGPISGTALFSGGASFSTTDGTLIITAADNAVFSADVDATPLPAALPLFAGGLGIIGLLARRKKRKAVAAMTPA
jgi:hypothetical protein